MSIQRRCFFCGSILLFVFHVCYAVLSVPCSLVVTCREKVDLLTLLYVMFLCFVTFPYGVLGQVWYLIYRFLIFAFFLALSFQIYIHRHLLFFIHKHGTCREFCKFVIVTNLVGFCTIDTKDCFLILVSFVKRSLKTYQIVTF